MCRILLVIGVVFFCLFCPVYSQDLVTCPPAPSVDNAVTSGKCHGAVVQDVCTYTCATGYFMDGNPNITCEQSEWDEWEAEWTDLPQCIGIECDHKYEEGQNATWHDHCDAIPGMECEDYPYALCVCIYDYVPDGAGACKHKDIKGCSNLTAPVNGVLLDTCTDAQDGDNCTVQCRLGFTVVGLSQMSCQGGTWDRVKPTCRESKCTDRHSGSLTWNQHCLNVPFMECQDTDRARCVCQNNFVPVTQESCTYPSCSDTKDNGGTWTNFCAKSKLKCHTVSEAFPRCRECMDGFIQDPRKNCRAMTCFDETNVGLIWWTWCLVRNRKCVEVENQQPTCRGCREGFLQSEDNPEICRAPNCEDSMAVNVTWMSVCDSQNRNCVPDPGGKPTCQGCKDRFVEDANKPGSCRASKCGDKHPQGVIWSTFCEKNPNMVCKDESDIHCACKDGFMEDGAGGCKDRSESGCSNLLEPESGVISGKCAGAGKDDKCVFECAEGFVLQGPLELTCLENGRWDQIKPVCRKTWYDPDDDNQSQRLQSSLVTTIVALLLNHLWI